MDLFVLFLLVGKFVPPPVSPVIVAKSELATSSATDKLTSSANNSSKLSQTEARPIQMSSSSAWRRPSISASSPQQQAASFPQRKVPALIPDIELSKPIVIPEPFADFPSLPGMKMMKSEPVDVVCAVKTLSLISDESSWLDSDEIDYNQQLFADSEMIFQSLKIDEEQVDEKVLLLERIAEEKIEVKNAEKSPEKPTAKVTILKRPEAAKEEPKQKLEIIFPNKKQAGEIKSET